MNYIKAKNRNRKRYTKEELKQIRDKEKDLKAQFLKKINENDKNNHNDNEIILDANKDSSGINIVEIKELLKEKKSLKKDIDNKKNKKNRLNKQKKQKKYIKDIEENLEEKYKNEFEAKKQKFIR
jgi:hypothetical protein